MRRPELASNKCALATSNSIQTGLRTSARKSPRARATIFSRPRETKEGARVAHDRPRQGHALSLSAGKLARLTPKQRFDPQHQGRLLNLFLNLVTVELG
jgi:hypothetical protein